MFRRCCGKRNAKKASPPSPPGDDKPPKDVVVELLGGGSDDGRPASSLLLRDNDFRNIDNNSVLVEFQENVPRHLSQSTETIPASGAATSMYATAGAGTAAVLADNGQHHNGMGSHNRFDCGGAL